MEDVKLFCQVSTEFWSNSSDCMATLGTNTTEHTSEMELYIILHFRKLRMLELDTFNHKISSPKAKPVQCSPAIVVFSSDEINILQHFFSTIEIAPKVLDGMNMGM